MSNVLHRNLNEAPPSAKFAVASKFASGDDMVLDMSSGAAVTCLGHSCAAIKAAMKQQIDDMPYAHSAQWTSNIVEHAADTIMEASGDAMKGGGVTFYNGGAEAVEAAVRLAVQFFAAKRDYIRRAPVIMSRLMSYHGNTAFCLALSDHPRCVALLLSPSTFSYADSIVHFDAFAPSALWADRFVFFENGPSKTTWVDMRRTQALHSLERQLRDAQTIGRRAIVIIETVGGSTAMIAPPDAFYLVGVRQLCNQYGAVLIYDEVLCGNYRTGEFMAWQHYQKFSVQNLAPDIAIVGKGITAGYFPMSGVICNERIRFGVSEGILAPPRLAYTSTNQNSPIGCAAVVAAMSIYGEMTGSIKALGEIMQEDIMPKIAQAKGVEGVSGVGALWGIHFDAERTDLHLIMKARLRKRGVTAYSEGGTVRGKGNMIMFAPPYTMTRNDLHLVADAVIDAAGGDGAEALVGTSRGLAGA